MNKTANKNSDTSGIYINPIVNVYEESNNSGDISGFVDQTITATKKASNTEKFFISFRELNNKLKSICSNFCIKSDKLKIEIEVVAGRPEGNGNVMLITVFDLG